uniref:Transcription repressor n=1 Tax=Oryza punctata TaxID=4537 RepID=A0A0E0L131_ORYPU
MSSHERFRLSHLMPNSWFYKLRDMKRPRPTASRRITAADAARSARRSSSSSSSHHHHYLHGHGHGATTPKPLPLSPPPQRSYYPYLQRPRQMSLMMEKQFHLISQSPLHQRSPATAIAVDHHDGEFQDLQLRPIRTRPPVPPAEAAAASTEPRRTASLSGTCPSSPRLRSRRLHVLGGCECKVGSGRRRSGGGGGGGFAVVKASAEPARDFRESMVEMVVENGMRSPEDLLELLECYLSLNTREHHGVIMEAFRGIWAEIVADADCCVEL